MSNKTPCCLRPERCAVYPSWGELATTWLIKKQLTPKRLIQSLLFAVGALFLAGCEPSDTLEEIRKGGELRVVTRTSPTTFYRDNTGSTGFEYQLMKRFADDLGVDLVMVNANTLPGIFRNLREGTAHIAAAGLTLTDQRANDFLHSQAYFTVKPQVIYQSGSFRPTSIEDLYDHVIIVPAESSHAQLLEQLVQEHPKLRWEAIASVDATDLLDSISEDRPFAILDDYEYSLQQPLFPRLKVAFTLPVSQSLVWYASSKGQSAALVDALDAFISDTSNNGVLAGLAEEFFSFEPLVSRSGSYTFSRNMETELPQYENLIRQVAHEFNIDWALLAAIAYQESHWNPKAKSYTGVRGMMMLTQRTANELDVTDRLNPLQSLRGGARYLNQLRRRLAPEVAEPDRTYLAMAAYNVGMGHLNDARILAAEEGGDPNAWEDVMQQLPKLQKPVYYRKARYGYARGSEAVTYVQNIRHYRNILEWRDISEGQVLNPHDSIDYLPHALQRLSLQGF
jgi:membrane-bound lytic murein transglycosylase F